MNPAPPRLVHACDSRPGIRRVKCGRGFRYIGPQGEAIADRDERARLQGLGIPPAWTQVWICPDARGHIQATGVDAAGRKQYRYHPAWRAWRERVKFHQLARFGRALPRLRRQVHADLERSPGSAEFTIAAVVLLLDHAHLRIGSRRHLRRSGTYGATTLQRRHLRFADDGSIQLQFRAKGGQRVQRTLRDHRLQKVLQAIDDLPGRDLFTWVDDAGAPRVVSSHQVNEYLAAIVGEDDVTAKTFRTWAGSVAALERARRGPPPVTIKSMTEAAARRLHNTPAICRSSYVHPGVLELATLDEALREDRIGGRAPNSPRGLTAPERRLLGLLEAAEASGSRARPKVD